ncbi:uncharacterized protein LOC126655340 [Mercurialis annua]|uniref:uncharacterized protein LOC126655340 n=1 Tax=Mercurialis annua TaxID=3986 RepID=UPI00215F5DA6|nr:uncharacterized protein LOC126655340 [Mercurialis annua]
MGGDGVSGFPIVDEDCLVLQNGDPLLSRKVEDTSYGLVFGEVEEVDGTVSPFSLEFEANKRQSCKALKEMLLSYDELQGRVHSLNEAKTKILSYTPGGWMEKVGGMELSSYKVPKTTTLLLVGPKGSGKSSLVNRISKVFEDDKFAPERAQVSYNYSAGDGTYFLQEYRVPRGSASFCLYDTRGLSDDSAYNSEMLKDWMTKGVCHGELIIRSCDNSSLRERMHCKARGNGGRSSEIRMVNFVIYVVSGLEVLKSMDSKTEEHNGYAQMIATTFNCPYLSFKDARPVVVVTHGDLLSLPDRARVRMQLGELLGVPPTKQIFDIPESCDPLTELTIIDMLRYSLEHADKNLAHKDWVAEKVHRSRRSSACVYLIIILGIAIILINRQAVRIRRAPEPEPEDSIEWHTIRHIWSE